MYATAYATDAASYARVCRRLELHDNRLTSLGNLKTMTQLRYLSLHGNSHVTSGMPSDTLMRAYLDGEVSPLLDILPHT
jgi:hypothetical protein